MVQNIELKTLGLVELDENAKVATEGGVIPWYVVVAAGWAIEQILQWANSGGIQNLPSFPGGYANVPPPTHPVSDNA